MKVDGAWISGMIEGYKISAKVYTEGSEYGIGGGKVSKLWAKNIKTGKVYEYDRGDEWGPLEPALKRHIVDQLEIARTLIDREAA